MDHLCTQNNITQTPIHLVDKELLNLFDPNAHFYNVYDMHRISNLTTNDKLLLDIVLKQHHWSFKDYLDHSVMHWII